MKTKQLLTAVSGTGNSEAYYIDSQKNRDVTDIHLFPYFGTGTVIVEGSHDGVNFAPIKDCTFTASEVVPLDPADRSFIRISYVGVDTLTLAVVPKVAEGS